jgi:hypothetical protein
MTASRGAGKPAGAARATTLGRLAQICDNVQLARPVPSAVMATDPSGWIDFAGAIVAATGALVGLIFVALSINVDAIIKMQGIADLALEGIGVLTTVLIAAIVVLTPGQSNAMLAAELIAIGLLHALFIGALGVRSYSSSQPEFRHKRVQMALGSGIPGSLVAVAGLGLATGAVGGLYWLVPACVLGIIAGIANAWVLLIEIKR